jgi:hypothetical protein
VKKKTTPNTHQKTEEKKNGGAIGMGSRCSRSRRIRISI